MPRPLLAAIAAISLGAAFASPALAQPAKAPAPETLKREMLQSFDVPPGAYEVRIGTSELAANRTAGRRSHPGLEAGYVLSGGATMLVAGQPPLRLKAGESYKIAAGAVHELKSGPHGVKLLITWVVDKGKPFEDRAN